MEENEKTKRAEFLLGGKFKNFWHWYWTKRKLQVLIFGLGSIAITFWALLFLHTWDKWVIIICAVVLLLLNLLLNFLNYKDKKNGKQT